MRADNKKIRIIVSKKYAFDLESFVVQNAPYMTLADMEDETGFSSFKLTPILEKLGIKPIGQQEKIKNFILDHYESKSKIWMMKTCDMTRESINKYYKHLNIKEPVFKSKKYEEKRSREIKSVAQILSNVHVPRNI